MGEESSRRRYQEMTKDPGEPLEGWTAGRGQTNNFSPTFGSYRKRNQRGWGRRQDGHYFAGVHGGTGIIL